MLKIKHLTGNIGHGLISPSINHVFKKMQHFHTPFNILKIIHLDI